MKIPLKKDSRTTFNFFPDELLQEARKALGEEFTRLPKRIQTGYIIVLHNHHNIIKSNQHSRDADSFFMKDETVESYFNDARDFRVINDNGYYLRPKRTRHGEIDGEYVLLRKAEEGATYYEPTNWLISTVSASQGYKEGKDGWSNGFQLSTKFRQLFDRWNVGQENNKAPLTLINNKDKTIEEVTQEVGGAIDRRLSTTDSSININTEVRIDTPTLEKHKEQLLTIIRKLEEEKGEEEQREQWRRNREIGGELAAGERGAGAQPSTIGGVEVKHTISSHLQSLLDKGFDADSVRQRIDEIDRLLINSRGKVIPTVPVMYEEVSTGRYTARGAVLQGYYKSVRYAALKGCYEYDLEAAHQTILLQLIMNDGLGLDWTKEDGAGADALRYYTRYKSDLRETLAMEITADYGVIKSALQALTYGADLSTNNRKALYKVCYGDEDLISRIINHSWIRDYVSAFKLGHKILIGKSKTITNDVGIKIESKGEAKDMAHILQGCERQVLDAIIKHSNRDDIALLVHDCVVFYNKQSTDELSRIVKEETGFELEFSEERY